jgi:prominin 1
MSQLDNFMKNNDLFDAVKNGKEKLENIKNTIGEKVNETLKEARVKITEAGDQIRLATKNVTDAVGDLQHQIDVNTGPAVTTADEYITLYGAYPYYGALAISCVLLLITICIALGLICGICGKRPEGYGDDCCNKGTGSDCLVW